MRDVESTPNRIIVDKLIVSPLTERTSWAEVKPTHE